MQNLLNTNSFLTKISVQEASVGKFICPKCPGFFTNLKTEYERHLCENHGIYDKISCIYCSYNFDFNKISSHIESHFDESLMSTNICNICHEFVKMDCQESVLDHLMFYHNNEFICPICKFIYIQESDLVDHINENLRIIYHCSFENCLVKTSSKEDFEFHVNSSNHQNDRDFEEHIFNCLNTNYEENNVKFSDDSFLNSLFSNDNSDEKMEDKIISLEKKFDYILRLNYKKELFNREFKNLNSKMSLYLRKKLQLINQFFVGVKVIKSKKLFFCSKCDHSTPYGHADTRKHILINHCQIKSIYVPQCLRTVKFTHHEDFPSFDVNNTTKNSDNSKEFSARSVNNKLSNLLISDDDLPIDKCNDNSHAMTDDLVISNRLITDDNSSANKRNIKCQVKSDDLAISNELNSDEKRNINYPIKLRFSKDKFQIFLKNLNTQVSVDLQRKLRSIHRYSIEVSLIQGKKLFFCSECNYVSHHHHTDVRKHIIVIHCGVACIYLHKCLKAVDVFDEGVLKRKSNLVDLKAKKTKVFVGLEEKRTTRSSICGGFVKDLSMKKEGEAKQNFLMESKENKENLCQEENGIESNNHRKNIAVKVARKVLQNRNFGTETIKINQPRKISVGPQISNNGVLVQMNYSEKVFKKYFQNINSNALKSLKEKMDNFKNYSMMISVLNNSKIFLCVDCGFKSSHNPGTTKKHIMTKHCGIEQIYLKECLQFCISSPESNSKPLPIKEKIPTPVETLDLGEQDNLSLNKKRQSSIELHKSFDTENISLNRKRRSRKTNREKDVEIPVKSQKGKLSVADLTVSTSPENIHLITKRQSFDKKDENTTTNCQPSLAPDFIDQENVRLSRKKFSQNVEIPVKSRKRKPSFPEQEISFSEAKLFFESVGRESLQQNPSPSSLVSKEETSQEIVPLKRKRRSVKDQLENPPSLSNEATESLVFNDQEDNVYRTKKIQSSIEEGKICRKISSFPDRELFPKEEEKFLEFSLPESFSQTKKIRFSFENTKEKIDNLPNTAARQSFPELGFISNKSWELSGQGKNKFSFEKEVENPGKNFQKGSSLTVEEMFSDGDKKSGEVDWMENLSQMKKSRPSLEKDQLKLANPTKPCQRSSFSVEELLCDEVPFIDRSNWPITDANCASGSLALVRCTARPSGTPEIPLDYSERILEALFKTEKISDRFGKVKEKMEIYRQTSVGTVGGGTGRGPVYYRCSICDMCHFQSVYDVSRHVIEDHTGIGHCLIGLVMISAQLDNHDRLMSDDEISELGWKGRPILSQETARFSTDLSNY